ncbi:hypothetical protein FQN54_004977 [Arachnomyces sp. PD_36]|nr:hypothetical protein FQN54_004977 [Arachnomyces sp. PD_36]
MLRQSIVRPALRLNRLPVYRSFSSAPARMGEGDTGAPKKGMATGDAWTKRETSQEAMYVHDKERQKFRELKQSIAEHQKHLDALKAHIADVEKNQGGGEQN